MEPRDIRFDPSESVLVVIDVQNDFCDPAGLMAKSGQDISRCEPMVDNLSEVIDAARRAAVPVIFVVTTHSDETSSDAWRRRSANVEEKENCLAGTWGAELYRLKPEPGDTVATKHRYSAFTSAEFCDALDRIGRRSLVFTGIATNICVETTLRDAVCADYYTTLLEDCCTAYSEESHLAGVKSVAGSFGVVASRADIVQRWNVSVEMAS